MLNSNYIKRMPDGLRQLTLDEALAQQEQNAVREYASEEMNDPLPISENAFRPVIAPHLPPIPRTKPHLFYHRRGGPQSFVGHWNDSDEK